MSGGKEKLRRAKRRVTSIKPLTKATRTRLVEAASGREYRHKGQARKTPPRPSCAAGRAMLTEQTKKTSKTPRQRQTAQRDEQHHTKPERFHAHHSKPVREPLTGRYATVMAAKVRIHPHVAPRPNLSKRSGKLKRDHLRHTPPAPRVMHGAPPPERPAMHTQAFSTQGELYRFHKANGTLHVYFRMYGIDADPA